MDGVDGKETGTDQTRSQSSFESIAANLSEDNYNGAVECDVNEMISYRIEPTDQIIPPLKRKFFPYTLKNSLSFKFKTLQIANNHSSRVLVTKIVPEREDRERPVRFVTFHIGESRTPEIVGPNTASTSSLAVSITNSRDIFVVPDSTQVVMYKIPV